MQNMCNYSKGRNRLLMSAPGFPNDNDGFPARKVTSIHLCLSHAVLNPATADSPSRKPSRDLGLGQKQIAHLASSREATFRSRDHDQIKPPFGEKTPWRDTLVDLGLSTLSGSSFAPPALALATSHAGPREPLGVGDAGNGKAF